MLTSIRRLIPYANPDRSDRPDIPTHIKSVIDAVEIDMIYAQGTAATRASRTHLEGTFFFENDTGLCWYDDGSAWNLIGADPTQASPPGVLNPYAGASAPTGWLMCDGSSISRTTYAALFTAIGVTYGVGDGSTTFGVPDLRGRMPVGRAAGGHADVATLAANEGQTLGSRRPKHRHTVGGTYMISGGVHFSAAEPYKATAIYSGSTSTPTVGPQTVSPVDSPAYLVVNYIIKT
jgi:microcystin-dependent protein